MAIVVIVLGLVVSTPFQIFVHENAAIKLPALKWYKWLRKPEFYLVSVDFINIKVALFQGLFILYASLQL